MQPCRKKVLLAFGAILIAVVLFAPYRSIRISEVRQRGSNLITRTTTADRGFLFLPHFIKAVSRNGMIANGSSETYRPDIVLWACEIAAVLILAVLDGIFLCPKGHPRRPGQGF
jgi:hypothetical protein